MTAVYTYCTVVLGVAVIVALLRMERGPSMLDRVVALDVVTAAVLGSIAVITARTAPDRPRAGARGARRSSGSSARW